MDLLSTKIQTIDLKGHAVDTEAVKLLGRFYCDRYGALPVKSENGRLFTAMCDPTNARTLADLADLTGMFIEPLYAEEADIRFYINEIFGTEHIDSIADRFLRDRGVLKGGEAESAIRPERLRNAPAVQMLDSLIETAMIYRASDIHIEPTETSLRARFRVDGRLSVFQRIDLSIHPNIISRLKVIGGMDIAEKRLPQDGRFNFEIRGEVIEFRLSTLPTIHGEKAVLRLHYKQKSRLRKSELGFFADDLATLTGLFNRPYGAVFITGPTGSGKTTTLNSFLSELNTGEVNIVTVEDPVENPIHGVNHMNVEPAAGLTFANALRHILRQDPDIIMIGEIRDSETARIAIQAAVTGHLVLSTLHTNDAAGVLERLVDMGIEPYLVAAALNGVISQRLVRRICPECRTEGRLTGSEAALLGAPEDMPSYFGTGCVKCNGTGYRGRFALYEYILMDDNLRRRMIGETARFASRIRRGKYPGIKSNGVRNIAEGNATPSDVIRALNIDASGGRDSYTKGTL